MSELKELVEQYTQWKIDKFFRDAEWFERAREIFKTSFKRKESK